MRDVQAQVIGQITSSPTNNGGTKFVIPLSNGENPSCFDVGLATKASQTGGQVATFRIEDVVKGNRTYHNLVAVAIPGEQLDAIIPQAGTQIAAVGTVGIVPAQQQGGGNRGGNFRPGGNGGGMSPEDKIRVTKLSCLSTAAALLSGSGDVDALFEVAMKVFNAVMQPAAAPAPSQAQPQAPAPQIVAPEPIVDAQSAAAVVNAQAGAPVVAVGTEQVVAQPQPAAALPWTTA